MEAHAVTQTWAARDPLRQLFIVLGDFNFPSSDKVPVSIDRPDELHEQSGCYSQPRKDQRFWEQRLAQATGLQIDGYTHFDARQKRLTDINHMCMDTAAWVVSNMQIRVDIVDDPAQLHERGISDHAPVIADIGFRPAVPARRQPLPRFVVAHPEFAELMHKAARKIQLDSLSCWSRLRAHKILQREVGRHVRTYIFWREQGIKARAMALISISRAVSRRDDGLARTLVVVSPLAKQHLRMAEDGYPSLVNPPS